MQTTPFSIEEVARLPLPGMVSPGSLSFSPDGRWIAYLFSPDANLIRQLYIFDRQTGKTSLVMSAKKSGSSEECLSKEERLRRERIRQYELGITSFAWSPVGEWLLIQVPEGLCIMNGVKEEITLLLSSQDGPIMDPQISPDGKWIAFIQNSEIYLLPSTGGEPRQLTHGAREAGLTHGLAEYIAQEEMHRRHGYWWSPDSAAIAFEQVDDRHIPIYNIVHQGKESLGSEAQEGHHYPFAGQENAHVKLGIIQISGGEPVWMDLGSDPDFYLARVDWFKDGQLAVQIQNRIQTEVRLELYSPHTGKGKTILVEINPVWVELNDLFRPLADGRFIWGSERSGFQHLYLYNSNGEMIQPLTSGDWQVDSIAAIDETTRRIYFTSTKASTLESQLYSVCLDGGGLRQISREPGFHGVVVNPVFECYIDTHDALDQPPMVSLRSLEDGSQQHLIYYPCDPRVADEGLQPPKIVEITGRDGARLYGAIYRPAEEYGPGPYPTIVQVYGGPHAQLVVNGWRLTANMRAQYLRSLGFIVFVLDNRGSARRGLSFTAAVKHHLGTIEVDDQVDGVRWLVGQGLADPQRVAITGWSYGGYMSLMCLARAPEIFKAAIAGAPVTAWDGYDTHYTEHYMGTPQSNPDGYRDSAVATHVENMQGKLLLVHGLIDENVHFRHTARLINALIKAHKPYELMLFPDERHGPRRLEDRVYLEERMRDFFIEAFDHL